MNQRSRNRRSDATVLAGQLVQRRNGRRIAQNHGDLTATGNAGGFALGASLWLHSGRHLAHVFNASRMRLPPGQLIGSGFRGGRHGKQSLFNSNANHRASLLADRGSQGAALGKSLVHGYLRSGPIPLMSESYADTSNLSTGIYA